MNTLALVIFFIIFGVVFVVSVVKMLNHKGADSGKPR